MTSNSVLQSLPVNSTDKDKSPARKRARYESPIKERWSLVRGDVLLDEVYDCGVSLLADSESDDISDDEKDRKKLNTKDHVNKLEPTVSSENLKAIALKEWNEFVTRSPEIVDISTGSYFEELSDEMILHIFHFLPKSVLSATALVCRRWHRLTQDESLWARMDVSCRQLCPGALGHILSRQVMILRLAQSDISYPPIVEGCRAYSEDFRSRLLFLDLSMAHIGSASLVDLLLTCRRLKKISLEHVPVDTEVMSALALNTDIEVINLAMAEGLNEQGLKCLLSNCTNIKVLNLSWTYLSSSCLQYVCSHLPPSLGRLNISGCRKLLTDNNVLKLVTRCSALRELDLSDCTGITGESVQHMTLLEDLNFLALSRCYQIPYRSLLHLKQMPTLAYLDVHGYIDTTELQVLQEGLGPQVYLNKFKFSSIARPTVGSRRSSIWNMRVCD